MGITIPSNPKLTAGNILCMITIGIVVLLIVANNYFHDTIPEFLNYFGVVAAASLCIGAILRRIGKQEQRADFNIALQQKLKQGLAPDAGQSSTQTGPTNVNLFQIQNPNTQATPYYEENTHTGFMTCPACGKQNDANNSFCNNCSAKLN